jgi:hypothetical protein
VQLKRRSRQSLVLEKVTAQAMVNLPATVRELQQEKARLEARPAWQVQEQQQLFWFYN